MATKTSLAVSVRPRIGNAPVKLFVFVRFEEAEFRGAGGCLIIDGPKSTASCWKDDDGIERSPIVRRVTLDTPGEYDVYVRLGNTESEHQTVRVS